MRNEYLGEPDLSAIDRLKSLVAGQRLVDVASRFVDTPSPTGSEQAMAEQVRTVCLNLGLSVSMQEVESGRSNVVASLPGAGGGPTLMFNGHMDTSYSGAESQLRGIVGFQPRAVQREGRLYGLGVTNMKGAIACYLEAIAALLDSGLTLRGNLVVAAVAGEIEKSQWGDELTGSEYRGYSAGSHYLVAHGGVADFCILGEPTENRLVLSHYGTLWVRIACSGEFVHTAFATPDLGENSIARARRVLADIEAWMPSWVRSTEFEGKTGVVNISAIRGGDPSRLSRTPKRTDIFLDLRLPPTMRMQDAMASVDQLVRDLQTRYPTYGISSEVLVTVPGARMDQSQLFVEAVESAHESVFGKPPQQDVVLWSSDASVLSRFDIPTVNYGTSSGLPGSDGESLAIEDMVRTAQTYAVAAALLCGAEGFGTNQPVNQ